MSLDRAWNDAQTRLNAIRSDYASWHPPPHHIFRVGQLDAELLDQELAIVLKEPLSKTFAAFKTSYAEKFDPELTLFIQMILYKLSVWDIGASYGAKLQGLRYITPATQRSPSRSITSSLLPKRLLLIHGTLTILFPYLHARLRRHALSGAWPDAPSSDWRRKTWEILSYLESIHSFVRFSSFIMFLWSGRCHAIVDILLNMRLVPSHRLLQRDVSYEFMNRQMVWQAFTEFLLFALPFVSMQGLRRRLNRLGARLVNSQLADSLRRGLGLLDKLATTNSAGKTGIYWLLPLDQCAICAHNASLSLDISQIDSTISSLENSYQPKTHALVPDSQTEGSDVNPPQYPIHNPYMASCGHVYCYHCIADQLLRSVDDPAGERGWECLRCKETITSADRLVPELLDVENDLNTSEYEFSSDYEVTTDLSASIGSYSESILSDA